ncbi:MAG: alpha/beta hydrolase [Pseudomonadota bacterium]
MTTWVLLRGWARESRHWGSFPELLARRLGEGHDVIALDAPGNGKLNLRRSPMSVPAIARCCRAQLEASGARPPFVLLGLSLGAMVALEWAHAWRREVEGVIFVNGSYAGYAPPWRRLRPGAWGRLLSTLLPGTTLEQRESTVLALTSNAFRGDERLAARWAAIARYRPVSSANALRQLIAAARYRAPRRAPEMPALMVTSYGDRLVSHRCSTTPAARWGVPIAMHHSAGHDLPLDDPEWLAAHAVAWWRGSRNCHQSATVASSRAHKLHASKGDVP